MTKTYTFTYNGNEYTVKGMKTIVEITGIKENTLRRRMSIEGNTLQEAIDRGNPNNERWSKRYGKGYAKSDTDRYIVYCLTFPNGKVYIGKARGQDLEEVIRTRMRKNGTGYKRKKKLFEEIQKHGWSNIKKEAIATGLSWDEAHIKEGEEIAKTNGNNYNSKGAEDLDTHIMQHAEKHRLLYSIKAVRIYDGETFKGAYRNIAKAVEPLQAPKRNGIRYIKAHYTVEEVSIDYCNKEDKTREEATQEVIDELNTMSLEEVQEKHKIKGKLVLIGIDGRGTAVIT